MPYHPIADPDALSLLCRIKLTIEEKKMLSDNLSKILDYMDLIDEVDTEGIPPCTHVLETIQNVMAEDEEGPPIDPSLFFENVAEKIGQMIKVPPVIETS